VPNYYVKDKFNLIKKEIINDSYNSLKKLKRAIDEVSENKLKTLEKKNNANYTKYDFKILDNSKNQFMIELFTEILVDNFFEKYTDFINLQEFIKYYPLQLSRENSEVLDDFIKKYTNFKKWNYFICNAYDFSFNKQ